MIELNHIVKKFGDLVAVNDLTLTVRRGEFFAVLSACASALGGKALRFEP